MLREHPPHPNRRKGDVKNLGRRQLGYRLISLIAVLTLLAAILQPWNGRSAKAVIFDQHTPIVGPAHGSADKVYRSVAELGITLGPVAREYIAAVYAIAPTVGIDPAVVIAQSAHETGFWTSTHWVRSHNPAGIGIPNSWTASYYWPTGTSAAGYHVFLVHVYVLGVPARSSPIWQYRTQGPGYDGPIKLGFAGEIRTIHDFTGTWALDTLYDYKLARILNQLYSPSSSDPLDPAVQVKTVSGTTGSSPSRVRDGDINTSWALIGSVAPPRSAAIQIDLGDLHRLTSIRWVFRRTGHADSFAVRISTDGKTWTTIGRYGNAPSWQWQRAFLDDTARYIRFSFGNPNRDMAIGYLSEIEVHGEPIITTPTRTPTLKPTRTATSTPAPVFDGALLPITSAGGSSGTSGSSRIRDGNIATEWFTTVNTPSSAHVYVDLGGSGGITGIQWIFGRDGGAESYRLVVSDDKKTWTTLEVFSGAQPGTWQTYYPVGVSARYVRWVFTNPSGAQTLGYLGDVRIYGEPRVAAGESSDLSPTATASASPTLEIEVTGTPQPDASPTETADGTTFTSTPIDTSPTSTLAPTQTPTIEITPEPTIPLTETPADTPTELPATHSSELESIGETATD